MECEQYDFDYNKHIVVKSIIGTEFRNFTSYSSLFQGVDIDQCEKCMVSGYSHLGVPFLFNDLMYDELKCTLIHMGLKFIEMNDLELMPELSENLDDELLCGHCIEEKEK